MSNLEPIEFNHYKKISSQQDIIIEIKDTIYKLSKIHIKVRKIKPPRIIISVSSASAASELHLLQPALLIKLKKFNISQVTIVIR